MKLLTTPCDIAILTADQAWENYCNALHMAQATRIAIDRHRWSHIASMSLDRHFAEIERKVIALNQAVTVRGR